MERVLLFLDEKINFLKKKIYVVKVKSKKLEKKSIKSFSFNHKNVCVLTNF
jgi:hypothetical protein